MTLSILDNIRLRPIQEQDNPLIAQVIRDISAEFGLTADKGYTVSDPHLDNLFELYSQQNSAYWIVEQGDQVVGGGGIAPLRGGEPDVCELQKVYFLPQVRGTGMARQLALQSIDFARQRGFKRCYLETTASLSRAIHLYEKLGFQLITGPMGNTGHVDCEIRMLKQL